MKKEENILSLLARIYLLFIVSVYPLYVGFSGYDDIIYSKAVMFWTISVIFFIIFALFYATYRLGLKKADQPLPFWKTFTIPDWAALVFLLTLTISLLLSPYKELAWYGMTNRNDGYLTYFCMIVSYYILSRWYKPKWTDMTIFSIGSALVCIIGFLQFYGYDFLNLFPYDRYKSSGFTISFRSTIGNIDFVSAYVCMAIAIFGALYIKSKHPVRFLYLTTSAMNFVFMIIAGADSGMVGLMGAMVLLIPYWVAVKTSFGKLLVLCSSWGLSYVIHHGSMIKLIIPYFQVNKSLYSATRKMFTNYDCLPLIPILIVSLILLCISITLISPKFKFWPKHKTARIIGFCTISLVILIGLTGIEIIGGKVPKSNMIYQAREILHGNIQDNFGNKRVFIWRKSLESFNLKNSLFGTGSDTFFYAFGESNQREAKELHRVVYDKAHNDFIQILLCNGMFALISYLVFIFSIVILSIKKTFYDDFLLVALGGVLAYIIQSFFNIDTLVVTPIYWILLAIVRQQQKSVAITPNNM